MNWHTRDIISIKDFSRDDIEFLLDQAKKMELLSADKKLQLLKGKVIASLFFEPSTRTKDSFTAAIKRLGAQIVGFESSQSTSLKKGETLHDMVMMYNQYADAIIMRHPKDGAARYVSEFTKIPVINAGDGKNQHPTQTFLDLFTIFKARGQLDGLSIALVGDLKYGRVPHSLATALSHFGVRQYFVAPPSLAMPKHIKSAVTTFSEHQQIEEVIDKVDIIYMTRIQRERFVDEKEYEQVKNVFRLTLNHLKLARPNLKVMHALPRVNEIAKEIDATQHQIYFEQAYNGVPMRQALLNLLLGDAL